ncbi:MAG: hypothetical protein V7641_1584 [Blastocatellia bacterium]
MLARLTLPTIKGAAAQANVTEQTLHRWLKEEELSVLMAQN